MQVTATNVIFVVVTSTPAVTPVDNCTAFAQRVQGLLPKWARLEPQMYVLRQGDTISGLLQVPWNDPLLAAVLQFNNIPDPRAIQAGQSICLPYVVISTPTPAPTNTPESTRTSTVPPLGRPRFTCTIQYNVRSEFYVMTFTASARNATQIYWEFEIDYPVDADRRDIWGWTERQTATLRVYAKGVESNTWLGVYLAAIDARGNITRYQEAFRIIDAYQRCKVLPQVS
jgi:hypothetical protein